ncbi:MAG: CapA family protein, partial [Bacteroidota bacterium]
TITLLRSEGVSVVGTSFDSSAMFLPSVIERNSIRVGIVAYTQFVNKMESWDGRESWQGYISDFDSQRVQLEIEDVRKKADFVIASYHGGREYADLPDSKTREEMRSLIDAGADLVVGHHPHVPQGIEEYKGRLIFHSLGNFVFHQAPYWTQRGLGIEMQLEKQEGPARLSAVRLVPVQAGYQPALSLSSTDRARLMKRIQSLSNVPLVVRDGQYFVQIPNSQAHNDN